MSGEWEIASAIREAGRTIAAAQRDQKPKLVIVPLMFSIRDDLTDEQAHNIATMVREAFERAINDE